MIERTLRAPLLALAERYPVVTLTGPRQSGKTTLCRAAFPDKPYLSLKTPGRTRIRADSMQVKKAPTTQGPLSATTIIRGQQA